jgi:NhaP-type Na+/H+ or K+/H+ antiporter
LYNIAARAANVFPITALLNWKRVDKISMNYQVQARFFSLVLRSALFLPSLVVCLLQLWWAGLRGAIAYATALSFPSQHQADVVNATSWICLFTIFVMGGTTVPVLRGERLSSVLV